MEHEFGYLLHDAAYNNDREDILELIDDGYDVNGRNDKEETPLFVATAKGNYDAVDILLENMADPDFCALEQVTPLLKAVKGCHDDCVQLLLEKNANADLGDDTGWSPLHEACYKDLASIVEQLVKIGFADVNTLTEDWMTPLFTACQYGNEECVEFLLQQGADCELFTIHGDSALHIACQQGHVECAKLLIKDGFDVNRFNDADVSPLAIACLVDHYDCAKLLIDNGAEIQPSFECTSAESPLHIAARQKGGACISLLVDNTNVDVDIVCGDVTPLFAAASIDNFSACDILLSAGADPNRECISNDLEYTPLIIAAEDNYLRTMQELVVGGANVNLATFTSPLIMATRSESIACIRYLLSCDADVNFVDCDNNTALTTICGIICLKFRDSRTRHDYYMVLMDICRQILQAGADVSKLYQPDVYSPVTDLPVISSHPELVQLLLEFDGTRVETKNTCEENAISEDWKPQNIVCSPRQLDHLCRLVIRETLGYKRLKLIEKLPVPNNLKQFLSYKNVEDHHDHTTVYLESQ